MKDGILSLDLGTKTGWAYKSRDNDWGTSGSIPCWRGLALSGSMNFTPKRPERSVERYTKFGKFLSDFLVKHAVDRVYFEEVCAHKGHIAAHVYGGLKAQMQICCEVIGDGFISSIPCTGVPVGTIKKAVASKGNASKQDVIRAVNSLGLVQHAVTSSDEADALALLFWAVNNTKDIRQ